MFNLTDRTPVPPVSPMLEEFLKQRGAARPLGRPVAEVTSRGVTVPVPPGVAEEHVEEAIALAQKLAAMPMKDRGALSLLASLYVGDYFRQGAQGAAQFLLSVGIDGYVELMCQIALYHRNGDSPEITRRRLQDKLGNLKILFGGVERQIDAYLTRIVNDQLGEELVRLNGVLNDERELMSGAAERAQADATAERRRADALQAQLEQVKAQAAAREAQLERTLASERTATIARERTWNEARRQLEQDKAQAQQLAAQLNAELQQRDEAQGLTGVQETVTLASTLEALSLRRFLVDQGLDATAQRAVVTCPSGISAATVDAWRAVFPDAAAQRAQLRAAVAA